MDIIPLRSDLNLSFGYRYWCSPFNPQEASESFQLRLPRRPMRLFAGKSHSAYDLRREFALTPLSPVNRPQAYPFAKT